MGMLTQGVLIHYLLGAGVIIMLVLTIILYKLIPENEDRKRPHD